MTLIRQPQQSVPGGQQMAHIQGTVPWDSRETSVGGEASEEQAKPKPLSQRVQVYPSVSECIQVYLSVFQCVRAQGSKVRWVC